MTTRRIVLSVLLAIVVIGGAVLALHPTCAPVEPPPETEPAP